MRKLYRIIVLWIIILLIFYFYNQKISISELSVLPNNQDIENVLQINIIDKYNNMEKIYNNPSAEEFYEFDLIIGDIYYYNVGIRTKGSSIFRWLRKYDCDKYSFKVKLDYRNPEQSYNGMTELHLNAQAMDPTGMREYLVYDIYNEAGIDTQKYCFANLQVDNESIGLVTVVEIINEQYVEFTYGCANGNLYKPSNEENKDIYGAELEYKGDNIELYKAIFDNTKTSNTTDEDKQRLVSIIKKINEAKTPEEIESCFMDFDKVLKIIAINRAVSNVDGITGRTMRNYYIYEENGKIDIIPFDFNFSLGTQPKEYFFTQDDVNALDLIEYKYENHSKLIDIILENEIFLEKYNIYVNDILNIMDKMQLDKIIDEIDEKVSFIIQNDTSKYYSYEEYKNGIENLKEFIDKRIKRKI